MDRFFILLCFSALFTATAIKAQNVGIGTNAPLKLFSVNGSLMIDQSNTNTGTLDSAGLRFGSSSLVGISSNRTVGINPNGLDFWTNGLRRMVITSTGRVGIANSSPDFPLDVAGAANVSYLYTAGLSSTASIFTDVDLNANDDLFVGDDGTIMGNVGIGTGPSSAYKLYVDGNALITTNLGINGTLRVDGKITNDGKGIVKSNSSTTLRAGFSSGNITVSLSAGESVTTKFCILKFTGDNDNVRVMPAQFVPGSGPVSNTGCLAFLPISTTASDAACGGGSTATIRITNTCSSSANSGTNATLYLFAVATD